MMHRVSFLLHRAKEILYKKEGETVRNTVPVLVNQSCNKDKQTSVGVNKRQWGETCVNEGKQTSAGSTSANKGEKPCSSQQAKNFLEKKNTNPLMVNPPRYRGHISVF